MSQMNVGQVCRSLILKHDVAVKTSASCIAWYKNKMKKDGIILKKSQVKSIEIDLDTIEM